MSPFDGGFDHGNGSGTGAREKAIRLLKIAWSLQREDLTVDELAQRFGVSRRTIYRDLKLISEAGIPLVTQQQGKGYRVIATHRPAQTRTPTGAFDQPWG